MALLKFKRSAVAGKVPSLSDLPLGELAINTFDGKIYIRKDNGTASVVEIGAGAGTGVVSFNTRTGAVTLTSGDVTGALGYTPYNSTNPAGYINSINSSMVTTALGYTPANKAGETFTGVVSIHSINDAQLYLNGNGTTWAGISFSDVSNSDYLFYNGSTSTFSIGGGGSAVANKKLHINGGVTIGSGLAGTAVAANGLLVETQVAAPIFYDSNNTGYYVDPNGAFTLFTNPGSFYSGYSGVYVANPEGNGETLRLGAAWSQTGIYAAGNIMIGSESEIRFWIQGGQKAYIDAAANVFATGSYRAPIFYDSNNTAFYVSPDDNSFVSAVRARGQIRATGWWDSYSGSVNGLGIEIGQSGGRSFVISYNRDTGNYGPVSFDATDFLFTGSSGGYAHINTSFRAPVFYDSNNTAFYVDAEGTSNLNQINLGDSTKFIRGGATGQVILGTGGVNEAYLQVGGNYHSIWNAGNFDPATKANLGSQNIFTGVNYFFSGGNPQSGTNPSLQAWTNDNASGAWMSFHRSNQYAINIGLDSSNVFRIGGWSAPSDLFSLNMDGDLAVKRFISAGTGGFRQSAYNANARNRIYSFADADGYGVSYFQGTAGVGSADTIGMHFGLATGGGSQFIFVASGYGQASASFRAPFFYDSDNTGYYIDAAGTSFINALATAGSLTVGTDAFSYIYMGDSDEGNRAIHNNSNQIGFLTQGGSWGAFCTDDGGWYSNTAMFSPIYYDRDDTSRYVDPNGTSNLGIVNVLGGLTVNDGAVYRSDWTTRFQSSSDFVDGTLVSTNIPATATNGESFIIEITGKSYDGSNPPFKVIAQGYLYNDTIISTSGISYGGNFASSVKVFEDGGVLKFWWPRISYWNSFNVNVMGMDGPNSGTITRNRITSITNSTEPTGTKKQTIALARFMRSDTAATNSSALYAPLFYDSDNTNYFIDPTSTSVLNTIRLNAAQYSTGSTAMTLGSTYFQLNDPTGRTAVFLGGADPANYYDNTSHNFRDRNGSLYAYITPSGIWAGAFTDFNNTAYYVDPASNSVLNALYLRNGSGVEALAANTSSFGYSSSYRAVILGNQYLTTISLGYDPISNLSGSFNGQGEGREVLFRNGVNFMTPNSANNNYLYPLTLADGYSASSGSFRAPIFYDTDNTAYYVNPQGGTVLGGQVSFAGGSYVATNGDVYARRDSAETGVYYFADGGSKYLYWNGGSYIFGSAGPVSNAVYFAAPIFYDSDNSGYYIDAASTSVLNTLMVATGVGAYDSNNDPYGKISVTRNTDANYSYYGLTRAGQLGMGMGIDTGNNFWIGPTSAGYNGTRNASWISINNSGQITALGDFRAPIFYDSNNTSYYVDPNDLSRMNAIAVEGRVSIAEGQYFYMGGTATVEQNWGSRAWTTGGNHYSNARSHTFDNNGYGSTYSFVINDTGNVSASVDMRAPIFYDTANTSYYLNVNGASKLATLTLDGMLLLSDLNIGGNLTVGVDQVVSNIFMTDTDEGVRIIHCNSNRIGFLSQGSAWGSYCADDGSWTSEIATYSPIYYDYNDSGYYIDPAAGSKLRGLLQVEGNHGDTEIRLTALGSTLGSGVSSAMSWWVSEPNVTWNDGGFGYNVTNDGSGPYNFGRLNTSFGQAYTRYTTSGNMLFYCADTAGTRYHVLELNSGNYVQVHAADIRAPLFYDSNNTGYYVNPDSTTNLYSLVLSGNTYFQPNSWIQFNGSYGLYWPNSNGAHIEGNTSGSYTQLGLRGQKGGYGGLFDLYSSVNGIMYDVNGNGGVYREPNGRWYFYHNVANDCTGFGTSTTVSGYNIYVPTGLRSDGRVDGSLFYDVSNTAFYLDPNATGTSLNVAGAIIAAGNVTAYSDIRVKDNIETVENALAKVAAIRGVTYTRKDLDDKERRYAGVIAQEVEQVLPEAVGGDEHRKTVDYNGTIALLIEAVKELTSEVETLKAAIRSK